MAIIQFSGRAMDLQLSALQAGYDQLLPQMRKAGVVAALRTVSKPALQAYKAFAQTYYGVSKLSYYRTKSGKVRVRRMAGKLEKSAAISKTKAKFLAKNEAGVTISYQAKKGGWNAIFLADGTRMRATKKGFNRGQLHPSRMRQITSSQAEAISLQSMPAELLKNFNRQAKRAMSEKFEPVARRYAQQLLNAALR